jgi:hypothetical protein
MVGAIGGMGVLLVGVGRLVPSPSPTATLPASTPEPSADGAASPAPSATLAPTASLVAVIDPGVILAAMGDPAPITEAGQQVGTVTLVSAAYRSRIQGKDPPSGSRWLRLSMTFRATAPLTVDPTRWSVIDTRTRRHGWTGAAAPDPALGGIALAAGQSRTGYLVIAVPAAVDMESAVLQDADGHDIVVFTIR